MLMATLTALIFQSQSLLISFCEIYLLTLKWFRTDSVEHSNIFEFAIFFIRWTFWNVFVSFSLKPHSNFEGFSLKDNLVFLVACVSSLSQSTSRWQIWSCCCCKSWSEGGRHCWMGLHQLVSWELQYNSLCLMESIIMKYFKVEF